MPKVACGEFRDDGESMADKASDLISGRAGPQGGEVLTTAFTVTERIKRDGIRLFAVENPNGEFTLEGQVEGIAEPFGKVVRLWKAFTRHDIDYLSPGDAGISKMKSNYVVPEADFGVLNADLADDCSDVRRLPLLPVSDLPRCTCRKMPFRFSACQFLAGVSVILA